MFKSILPQYISYIEFASHKYFKLFCILEQAKIRFCTLAIVTLMTWVVSALISQRLVLYALLG